jgi:type II secretory pathway pseudopilin PulG
MKAIRYAPLSSGFTLVEVIGVIAAIAAVSAIGFVTVTNTKQMADATKLEQDVESINRSIQVYLSNGGNLTEATTTDAVLTKLKSRGDSSQMLGVTSSMLDARIVPDYGDNTRQLRARWVAADNQFIIEQGTSGVVEFRLDESLAATAPSSDTGTRSAPGSLASSGGWVWDTSQATEQVLEQGNTPGTEVSINASTAALLSHPGLTGGAYEVGPSGTVSTDNLYFDGGGYSSPLGVFSMAGMGNPPFDLTTEAGRHAFMKEAVRRILEGGSQGGVAMDRTGEGHDLTFPPARSSRSS